LRRLTLLSVDLPLQLWKRGRNGAASGRVDAR